MLGLCLKELFPTLMRTLKDHFTHEAKRLRNTLKRISYNPAFSHSVISLSETPRLIQGCGCNVGVWESALELGPPE